LVGFFASSAEGRGWIECWEYAHTPSTLDGDSGVDKFPVPPSHFVTPDTSKRGDELTVGCYLSSFGTGRAAAFAS